MKEGKLRTWGGGRDQKELGVVREEPGFEGVLADFRRPQRSKEKWFARDG